MHKASDAAPEEGADQGARDAGPIGGVIGGGVAGVVGGVNGLLGADRRPWFCEYVQREHIRSYDIDEPVGVGVVLRDEGIQYYEVPREYGPTPYRDTVIDDAPALVGPPMHRIVQMIE